MAEVINLNRYRKAKAKLQAGREAAANRSKYGREKVEMKTERLQRERSEKDLDGKKLD